MVSSDLEASSSVEPFMEGAWRKAGRPQLHVQLRLFPMKKLGPTFEIQVQELTAYFFQVLTDGKLFVVVWLFIWGGLHMVVFVDSPERFQVERTLTSVQ